MHRREFMGVCAGAAVTAAAGRAPATAATLPRNAATENEGVPFFFTVMLWTVYRDLPFPQRLEKVAESGYHAVELVGEFKDWKPPDFAEARRKKHELGMEFDGTCGVWLPLADAAKREAFLKALRDFIPTMRELDCTRLIMQTGDKIPGLSPEQMHANCIETLKRGADIAAENKIELLIENIDPEENPKYFLTSSAEGFDIVRSAGNPHVKFLYDLFHEQIVEKLDVRIAGGTDNVKTFCGAGQKIFGIFFRVDVFNEQLDLVFGGDIGTALKRFDAVGVHLLRREAGNLVAGLHDEARAVQFAHGGNEIAKGLEKSFTLGSVRKRKPHAAGAIELHAQLMLFAARFGKVRRLPILEFPDQLDGVIAGFGNLFETLRKREIAVDGPEHHGEGERNAFVLCGRVPWQCGGSCGSTTGGSRHSGTGTNAHEFASMHRFNLPEFRCERFSKRRRRVRRPLHRQEWDPRFQC